MTVFRVKQDKAFQWFKSGDCPNEIKKIKETERKYFHSFYSSKNVCMRCYSFFHMHGIIDNPEGHYTICPGTLIIEDVDGKKYPCGSEAFSNNFEL